MYLLIILCFNLWLTWWFSWLLICRSLHSFFVFHLVVILCLSWLFLCDSPCGSPGDSLCDSLGSYFVIFSFILCDSAGCFFVIHLVIHLVVHLVISLVIHLIVTLWFPRWCLCDHFVVPLWVIWWLLGGSLFDSHGGPFCDSLGCYFVIHMVRLVIHVVVLLVVSLWLALQFTCWLI